MQKNDRAVSLVSVPETLVETITENGINVQLYKDDLLRTKHCGYCKRES